MGLKIQQARKAAGYTQQQLCQATGMSYSTLAKIERGAIKAPSVFTIQQIAETLNTSIDVLIGAKPPESAKKTSKSGIKFVYFDINGCLVHFYHRAFGTIADASGVPADVIESVYWRYNDLACRGDMSLDEFNKTLSEQLKIKDMDWAKHYLEAIEIIPESQELLKWASENYRVGLLSNIMPGLIERMIAGGILPDLDYDAVIDSSKTGLIKPETGIYKLAEDAAKVKPEEILFIDDSRANIMAADKLGWRVMWFDDSHPADSSERIKSSLSF